MHLFHCVVILLAAIGLSSCSSPPNQGVPRVRQKAPEFALRDKDAKIVRLSEFRGRVVVLNFWATWCPPCRVEIPWLNQLAVKFSKEGLVVIGASLDEGGWPVVNPFLREFGVQYPIVLSDERTVRVYGVGPPPTTFLIGADGRMAAVFAGVVNHQALERSVEELLMQPSRTR